ncbi:MAG: hypothetical protein JHC87_01860 [Thermoleophilaceae bacterium]|nr:hypothetical protein [Thermoleophilaceae bacterium]
MKLTVSRARVRTMMLVVLVALSGALAVAPSASARKLANSNVAAASIDGTNVYWVAVTRSGLSSINRIDLATNLVTTIFTTPNRSSYLTSVKAGGGRLAFDLVTFGRTRLTTTIKVAAADGSGLADLVTNQIDGANDCGQVNGLLDVSETGEVFATAVTRTRTKITCAGAADADNSTVTGYPLAAAAHLVYQKGGPINDKALFESLVFNGQISNGNLLMVSPRSAIAVDVATGTQAQYVPQIAKANFIRGSIDASGRVLLSELKAKAKRVKLKKKKGKKQKYKIIVKGHSKLMYYEAKLNPAVGKSLFDSKQDVGVAEFCGTRIALATGILNEYGFVAQTEEIDTNGTSLRALLPSEEFLTDSFHDCDSTGVVLSGFNFKTAKSELQLVPFS